MKTLKTYQVTRVIYVCDEIEAHDESEAQAIFDKTLDEMKPLDYAEYVDACACDNEIYEKI